MIHKFLMIFIFNILFITPSFSNELIKILDKKYITVGVSYDHKPFGFINEDGKADGFEVELIKIIMDKLNMPVKFVEVRSKNKGKMLLENRVDMIIATITKNNFKNKKIIFSDSYLNDKQVLLVKKDFDTFGVLSLINKKIGTINSSAYLNNFLDLKSNSNMITFSSYPQLTKALFYDNIDAITADYIWAKTYIKDSKYKYKLLDYNISENYYFIAMKNEKFKNIINKELKELSLDNIYKSLYKKWFK